MKKIFLLISLLTLSLYSYSSTYYLDKNSGNDSNNGLSESNAWRSILRVNAMEFQPGDSILFKRDQEDWRSK